MCSLSSFAIISLQAGVLIELDLADLDLKLWCIERFDVLSNILEFCCSSRQYAMLVGLLGKA